MYIQSLNSTRENNKYNNFKAKNPIIELLSKEKINEKILQINKNNETKELFEGLSALAVSAVAGLALVAEKNDDAKEFFNKVINDLGFNKEEKNENTQEKFVDLTESQDKPIDISELIEEYPERATFLKVTSYFPNLDMSYKKLLETKVKEPENEKNNFSLDVIEGVFGYLAQPDKLMLTKSYFRALDENADILDKIAINVASTLKNGDSLMYYLVLLNNGNLSKEQICRWADYDALSCDEFMMTRDILNDEQLKNLNDLKKHNCNFSIKDIKKTEYENFEKQAYILKLNLAENMPVVDKLRTVSQVHEAIHGKISLKGNNDLFDEYILKDLKSELMDNLVKDHRLDAIYNIVKYIKPKTLKNYNLSSNDIKFLDKDSETYKNIKSICVHQIMNLDESSPKVQQIFDVLNDKDIYQNVMSSRHAKIRFLSRFVLKDNSNTSDLKQDTKEKMQILIDALNQELNETSFYCYVKSKRNAPQFYIKDTKLGKYIKITLNNEGGIHTIFEDFHKEQKAKEAEKSKTSN